MKTYSKKFKLLCQKIDKKWQKEKAQVAPEIHAFRAGMMGYMIVLDKDDVPGSEFSFLHQGNLGQAAGIEPVF